MSDLYDTIYAPDPSDAAVFLAHFSSRIACPEKRIRLAVIEQAVDDLRGADADARGGAIRWLSGDGDGWWPYAFEEVCAALTIDADWLRDKLMAELRGKKRGRR